MPLPGYAIIHKAEEYHARPTRLPVANRKNRDRAPDALGDERGVKGDKRETSNTACSELALPDVSVSARSVGSGRDCNRMWGACRLLT